jgi:hypothetical protein
MNRYDAVQRLILPTGRYVEPDPRHEEEAILVLRDDPSRRSIAYLRRRFLPQGGTLPELEKTQVQPGERFDQLAQRTLGDPELYWRICDANDAMAPAALLERPGRRLRVPLPQADPPVEDEPGDGT